MANERARHQLHEELNQLMTPESVDELMDYLPPVGWADVATKADLGIIRNEMDALRADLRGEMALFRGEVTGEIGALKGQMGELRGEMGGLKGEMGELRGEMGELKGQMGELRGEMGELRGEMGGLKGEMGELRFELRGELADRFVAQTRWLIGTIIVSISIATTVIGLVMSRIG